MKKSIVIALCVFGILCPVFSQNARQVDSLKRLLQQATKTNRNFPSNPKKGDTTAVLILIQLSKAHWGSDPTTATEYANQALALSEGIRFPKGIALAFQCLGAAKEDFGDYNSALDQYEKALVILKEINDQKGIASTNNNIGIIFYHQGNFPRALNSFLEALRIQEKINDVNGMANGNLNVGAVYVEEGKNERALSHFELAVKNFEKKGSKEGVALTTNNMGAVYKNMGQFDKALIYFNKALQINQEIGDKKGCSRCFNNIGETYRELKDYPEAVSFFSRSLKIKEEIGDKKGIAAVNSSLGSIYGMMGQYPKAIKCVDKALEFAREIGARDIVRSAYERRSAINAQFHNYESAYKDHVLFKQEYDSLFNQENEKKLTELRMQYEFDKKQTSAMAEQEKKDRINEAAMISHKRERIFYTVLGALLLFAVVTLWSRLNLARKTRVLLEEKNRQIQAEREIAEQQRIRAELMDMRNKIAKDLHDDIGSSLSSIAIYSEVAGNGSQANAPDAVKILRNVSQIAQDAMENMSDIVWSINPVNDKLDDLMKRLELFGNQLTESKDIKVHFDIEKHVRNISLTMQQRKNLYLIFKEAMNNIAKYSKASNCYIKMGLEKNELAVSVRDDGQGFDDEKQTLGGNGLINIHSRVAEMEGRIQIKSARGQGTQIDFSFKS